MARTRVGLLDATRSALAKYGARKATMGDVATVAGVAKATVYNHFRTRGELLLALADHDVASLLADLADRTEQVGLAPALAAAARTLGEHPVIRRLAEDEPGLLAAVALPRGAAHQVWATARQALMAQIATITGPATVAEGSEVVLRWLAAHLLWPGSPPETEAGARILVAGLAVDRSA